jgi:hypothetical protein
MKYGGFFLLFILFFSCKDDELIIRELKNDPLPNVNYEGRANVYFGCLESLFEKVELEIWTPTEFSFDMPIKIYQNGSETTLFSGQLISKSIKASVEFNLENKVYNNLTIIQGNSNFNEPIEVGLSLNGIVKVIQVTKESNAVIDVIDNSETNYECSQVDGLSSVMFWTNFDPLCGTVEVKLGNQTSQSITFYYSSAPSCGTSGCANFNNLENGIYQYKVECSNVEYSSGSIEIDMTAVCKKIKII